MPQTITLSATSHPYLADHEIAGTPVVPMAMVLEWFAREATRWSTDPLVLQEISVLRKITLPSFHGPGDRFSVLADHATLALLLLGPGDVPHFKASATRSGPRWPESPWVVPPDLRPPPRATTYDGHVLFHGPAFRSLRRVHGLSPGGAVGVVTGARELGWPETDWTTDPAAIDGGLQLAVLWAEQIIGGASLPMAVREFRLFRHGLLDGPIRCFVRERKVGPLSAECDIGFIGVDGIPRMELTGVSVIIRPDGATK